MPETISAKAYFSLVKENHKRYLNQNMVSHLELVGNIAQASKIEAYVEKIKLYRDPNLERYLEEALKLPSTSAEFGHGILSTLLGMGIGKLVSKTEEKLPLPSPIHSVASAFSTALGAGISLALYKTWKNNATGKEAVAYDTFKIEMEKIGFTDEKYAKLSAEVVKLFHYRECLLLGLKDASSLNIRKDFRNKFFPERKLQKTFNAAIEVYFLQELNGLFNEAFKDIYIKHDEEIQHDSSVISSWFFKYFTKPEDRSKFTEQIQIAFMNECIHFLDKEIAEPSFFAKHPRFVVSFTGLLTGTLALGLASLITACPVIGVVGIALVAGCLAASIAYLALNYIEPLQYKRNKQNRLAIRVARDSVNKEITRLDGLIQHVTETTDNELSELKAYHARDIRHLLCPFPMNKEITIGARSAWLREYAARYRHSKMVEIDLSSDLEKIIHDATLQTLKMQELASNPSSSNNKKLIKWINNTKHCLVKPKHASFIEEFEVYQKIKQQLLEIAAVFPESNEALEAMKSFYITPRKEGGLGGVESDIAHMQALSKKPNQYENLLRLTSEVNNAISKYPKTCFVLRGDSDYRKMLGLSYDSIHHKIEDQITAANIQGYLQHSFDFLLSLNPTVKHSRLMSSLDTPFNNSLPFVLYRTLLLKQLTRLADSNNPRVNKSVKCDIERFVKDYLHVDPQVVFDDIQNHALFIQPPDSQSKSLSPFGITCYESDLQHILDATTLDLAYASETLTPKMLINLKTKKTLGHTDNQDYLFCFAKVGENLRVENSMRSQNRLLKTIETTKAFIQEMSQINILNQTGALTCYLQDTRLEIKSLKQQIALKLKATPNEGNSINYLKQSEKLLSDYQHDIEKMLNKNNASWLPQCALRFFHKEKPSSSRALIQELQNMHN